MNNMAHITEENLYAWVFDGSLATAAERSHIAQCPTCQQQLVAIQQLARELAIRKASEPSPTALARYSQLYTQIQPAPSLMERMAALLTAHLAWDGRQQPAWQGLRNSQVASYRLLYATDQAEIELLIARREGQFQLEGEVIMGEAATASLPIRCELQERVRAETSHTTACEPSGRFHLRAVPPGRYRLFLIPDAGATILIDDLDLQ